MSELLTLPALMSPRPDPTVIGQVCLVAPLSELSAKLLRAKTVQWQIAHAGAATCEHWRPLLGESVVATLVYVAPLERPPDVLPNLAHARAVLTAFHQAGATHAVVVSSTSAYGAVPDHAGLVSERRVVKGGAQAASRAWLELESFAAGVFGESRVTVLRAAPAPARGERDFYSRLLGESVAFTIAGHDPTLQLLSVRDLADAIGLAVQKRPAGIFNVVPAAPVPVRAALREAGTRPLPVPWIVHRAARAVLPKRAHVASADQVQFIRYHLTAAPEKSARELGFIARDTSLDTVRQCCGAPPERSGDGRFDPFGLDRAYIDASDRGFMGFLRRRYWRVETQGLDHIPPAGGGVLVGMHRGFMPFDGVMTLLGVVEGTGRVPRFLIHPGVGLRFPFLFDLMSKLGGVIACQENADRVLASGELLGVYPEGIRGAFTMYRRAHRIGPSWRDDCVAFALRHRVPLIPFVTVGSAEIFPILGRIKSRRWKQYTEWPFIPITPTFPLLPVPLPSKWHTLFLEPLHVEREHPPEAAEDASVVRAIGTELKRRMEAAVADLVSRRKSIFVGSLFEGRAR